MPGSLNYSPSGSEGGRSLGGGVDLEKSLIGVDLTTTPGTTPLKWRKRSSASSSGGRSVSVVEGCSTPATSKVPEQGQDGVPPRIATRRSSWDPTKAPGTPAEKNDRPTQPAKVPSASSIDPNDETAEASHNHESFILQGSAPLADHETDDNVNPSEDLGNAARCESDEERCQQNLPSSRRASAAAEEIAAALAKGPVAHSQHVTPDSLGEEQGGQLPKSNRTEKVADPTARDDGVHRQDPLASVQSVTNAIIRERASEKSPAILADETHSTNAAIETAAAGVDADHQDVRQLDNVPSVGNASRVSEASRGGNDSDDANDSEDHNSNNSSGRILNGEHPRTTPAPSGELSGCAESEGDRLQLAHEAGGHVESEKQTPTEAGPMVREALGQSRVKKAELKEGDVASGSDSLKRVSKVVVGSRRRSLDKADAAEDRGIRGAGLTAMGGGGEPHAQHIGPESNAGFAEREPSSSANQNLLQSPPVLSRRRSSGGGSKTLMEANDSSGGQGRLGEAAEVDTLRLDRLESGEKRPSTLGPPALTPRRARPTRTSDANATALQAVPPTPRSPIAAAAKMISQEESVRSTLRMKRAAEAIALEDAQMIADAERREQRRKPSGHQLTLPAPLENEYDDINAREEEEARARHDEKMRVRALRAVAAREEAEIERDRALELTLEVLRRRHADKRRGINRAQSAPGRRRTHSQPRRSRRPHDYRTSLARSVKDSAARSCGLSAAQVVLLRRSRQLGGECGRGKTLSERRTEELAEPKEERPATRTRNPATEALVEQLTKRMTDKDKRAFLHACLEDARECTHRPQTRSAAARRARDAEGSGQREGDEETKDEPGVAAKRDAFLYRVDAQERAKTAAMKHRRGELAYKAVLDKRVCPGCGAEQSYDEVVEKRKTCPNCEVEYRKPKTWAGVRKGFLKRVEEFQESKQHALQSANDFKQTQTRVLSRGGSHFDREGVLESDSEMDERERLFWEDIEEDFVSRLQEDAARRQESLHSRSAALYQDWTFQPTLSSASQRVVSESAWAGMTFLERMEGDLQRRREAAPDQQIGHSFGDSYVFDA